MTEYKWCDVTQPMYTGMPVYPGDSPVIIEQKASIAEGSPYSIHRLMLSSHTGTHIDAPCHYLEGKAGVDEIPLSKLAGRARLFYLPDITVIDQKCLEGLDFGGVERVLFRTRSSTLLKEGKFELEYPCFDEGSARFLVEQGIVTVGIDSLSIDSYYSDTYPGHHVLLGAEVVIIEGLYLDGVPEGEYEMLCLPLRIRGCDGAPARVVLRRENEL